VLIPEGRPVTVGGLFVEAFGQVKPGSPPVGVEPKVAVKLVQLPAVFSIDKAYWESRSKTVTAGRVSVTATVTPVKSVWYPGEPKSKPVVCFGPGTPINSKIDLFDYPCSYVYRYTSPVGKPFNLRTVVVFEVTASSNTGEPIGPLDNLLVESNTPIELEQRQVLNVPSENY
jgi:hypothetical protein